MSEETLDFIGEVFWYGIFIVPILIFPLIWKVCRVNNIYKIIIWLLSSVIIAIVAFLISMSICFRDGMGPT